MATSSASVQASAIPAAAAPLVSTQLSARGAFLLNAAFVVALLVLSQLPVLDQRPVVSASIVGAAVALFTTYKMAQRQLQIERANPKVTPTEDQIEPPWKK